MGKKSILKFCKELKEILPPEYADKVVEIFDVIFHQVWHYLPEDPEIYRANLLEEIKGNLNKFADEESTTDYVAEIVCGICYDCNTTISRGNITNKMESAKEHFDQILTTIKDDYISLEDILFCVKINDEDG